jgi:hypothetical protein
MVIRNARRRALGLCAAAGIVAAVSVPAPAFAQQVSSYGTGSTSPTSTVGTEPGFEDTVPTQGESDTLPFTGADVASLAIIGVAVAGTGVALSRSGRRRAARA